MPIFGLILFYLSKYTFSLRFKLKTEFFVVLETYKLFLPTYEPKTWTNSLCLKLFGAKTGLESWKQVLKLKSQTRRGANPHGHLTRRSARDYFVA